MPTFQQMQADSDDRTLVRKIQRAIAFLAPTTVELPEDIQSAPGALIDLKSLGFLPVGLVTPEGFTFSREIESEDIDALGYASPVRSDTTRVPRTVTFAYLEKGRKHMLELTLGTDLSGVTQNETTGSIVFDEPDLPVDAEYRLLILGSDGPASENWILGRGYHRVKLSATAEEVWGREGAVSQSLTLNVYSDDETGTPVRHYLGGTGAQKAEDILGFTS